MGDAGFSGDWYRQGILTHDQEATARQIFYSVGAFHLACAAVALKLTADKNLRQAAYSSKVRVRPLVMTMDLCHTSKWPLCYCMQQYRHYIREQVLELTVCARYCQHHQHWSPLDSYACINTRMSGCVSMVHALTVARPACMPVLSSCLQSHIGVFATAGLGCWLSCAARDYDERSSRVMPS